MIRIVRLSFKEENEQDFLELFQQRKELIKDFPGCSSLSLLKDKNKEAVYYTYSIWNHEDNLEAYRDSELFQDTWKDVKKWFKEPAQAFSADTIIDV